MVTVALSEILIGIGETTVMACSTSGIPQPEISWYKGNTSEAEEKPTHEKKSIFEQFGKKKKKVEKPGSMQS